MVAHAHPAAAADPALVALAAKLGWAILLSPLCAVVLILLFAIHRKTMAMACAVAGLGISLACTATLFWLVSAGKLPVPFEASVSWISVGGLEVPFGVLIDPLSLLMTLVVTGVGSAIFVYSAGYMQDDPAASRYFGMLSLFAFSILAIVLANNWVQLFIGWELVGFCSYMLIGHWYAKPAAADAGKKAFMVNRVADFGFMLGIIWLWSVSSTEIAQRTVGFTALAERLPVLLESGILSLGTLTVIGLLLFCGPVGKSAQFPLHVWLPDAMEGPTPVSALIHAATMVAAGVYMLARTSWLFALIPSTMQVILWVGVATAFLSAVMAFAENDLKRILAFSTLSQLGYMVMAMGLGGSIEGMYHLTTHACFKALLFLSAGSVIHATHEQNIWKLGGLWRSMRWTSITFLIGSLALIGFPALSGFFSKDEILVLARETNSAVYWLAMFTAGMTAFYTTRLWCVAFTGKSQVHHAHESGPVMVLPLLFLAVLSATAGYLGIPAFLGAHHAAFRLDVALTSTAVVLAAATLGWVIYGKRAISSQKLVRALALPQSIVENRFYIDDAYGWYVAFIQQRLIAGLCAWVEQHVIIGAVNAVAALTRQAGGFLRLAQTGVVQTYALVFVAGVLWLLASYL
jgi:NADH-quinone oxidoreductase subunit L